MKPDEPLYRCGHDEHFHVDDLGCCAGLSNLVSFNCECMSYQPTEDYEKAKAGG